MRKAKLSLIASIAVGLLAITTAGVSTYAWYNATTSPSIITENEECDITINTPDPIEVSNPQVYMYRGDPTGTSVTGTPYTLVDNVAARTLSNFYPGDKVTFAIKVTATSGSISAGSMDLTYRGFSLSNRVIQGQTTKVVNILSAIKVGVGANGTGAYPSMTEKVSPIARGSEPLLSSLTRVDTTTSYYKQVTINGAVSDVAIGSSTAYFFYTVEFINTPSTFYKETTSGGGEIYTTPANDNSTRYFTGNNSGSSTCYEGLKFNVTSASITVG